MKFSYVIIVIIALTSCALAYTPSPKRAFGQIVLGNKLILYGGATIDQTGSNVPTNEFAVLDLSKSWDARNPAWLPGSGNVDSVLPVAGNVLLPAGNKGDEYMVTFGGQVPSSMPQNDPNTVYKSVYDKNMTSWIYGGQVDSSGSNPQPLDELYRFDGRTYNWEQIKVPAGSMYPGPATGHTASLISGKMVVLGGSNGVSLRPMNVAHIFDTAKRIWTIQSLTGATPPPRLFHGSTITQFNDIFICGGRNDTNQLYGDAWLLNTTSWSWIELTPGQETGAPLPTPRMQHQCARSGSNVMIMFGSTDPSGNQTDNGIFVYDTLTGKFANKYEPHLLETNYDLPTDGSPESNTISQNVLSQGAIIGIVLGSVSIVSLTALIGLLLVLRHKKQQRLVTQNATPIEGDIPDDKYDSDLARTRPSTGYGPPSMLVSGYYPAQHQDPRMSGPPPLVMQYASPPQGYINPGMDPSLLNGGAAVPNAWPVITSSGAGQPMVVPMQVPVSQAEMLHPQGVISNNSSPGSATLQTATRTEQTPNTQ
ncbi:uncharacterized protein VTP21DRAFT_810 [Calcarisporiella thermophila]|uniref:uncharacterized protein n=1 Tax=Calcarisporiella thermophila TaxID=911321 RepID=UPI003742B763